jgi:hypothetical protein
VQQPPGAFAFVDHGATVRRTGQDARMDEVEATEPAPARSARRPDLWWIVPGAVLTVTAALVLMRSWDSLLANHPAYPLTAFVALIIGPALIVAGLRRPPHRPGVGHLLLRAAAATALISGAALLWWLQPLPADPVALEALEGNGNVVVEQDRSAITLTPRGAVTAGLVLYPGARVDPRAYAALGSRLAARGYRVVIVKCPYDLALLCRGDGAGFTDASVPWMIGGPSLGGPVAVRDAASDRRYVGVLLWAAYPLDDLSRRDDLVVASVSGTRDAFTTPGDIDRTAPLLPPATAFTAIEGGIHSFFGDYGLQPGDGTPGTTRAQAQERIIRATDRALRQVAADRP